MLKNQQKIQWLLRYKPCCSSSAILQKPLALGGGGNTFDEGGPAGTGFTIPAKLQTSGIGGGWGATVAAGSVTLVGTPDEYTEWTVTVDVFPDSIATTID